MFRRTFLLAFLCLLFSALVNAQNTYRYALNLNNLVDDKLQVELLTPKLQTATAVFAFPKIIPGTYSISDYGKFISNVKAFDASGKALPVSKQGEDQWKISNATKLSKITYTVEDVFDTKQKHNIYPMAATDFEEGKIFLLHTPGVFGYLNGLNKIPFEITVQKPSRFYGASALQPKATTATQDIFQVANLDDLYDSPIMYTKPDTATVQVGNAQVLVSVYSPAHKLHAKELASWMSDLLGAAKQYLGGKLPADRYAFLYYFRSPSDQHSFPLGLGGALEHNASSQYYLGEVEPEQLKNNLVDISAHEFFHIITPLTISSKEVKEFNFNQAVLSKHLWLYEGVTEYTAHHVQVKYGLNTPQEFLDKLSQKIANSRTQFNDSLSFTLMSKEAAGKYENQYNNVYEKGALIGAVLDVYLLHLSDGAYGLRNLTHDLGVRYGKDRYFNDDGLFDEIGKLTYPEIKAFLIKYVEGGTPIPYDDYFALAGVRTSPTSETKTMTFGRISPEVNEKGRLVVGKASTFNDFGKSLGYQIGDELYAFNGAAVTAQNFMKVTDSLKKVLKEGDPFEVNIGRANASGKVESMTLRGKVTMVTVPQASRLELVPSPTPKQAAVRKAWLTASTPEVAKEYKANPSDVVSIDAVIKATYDVISGPAGERNWERFNSLFLPGAKMGASVKLPTGETAFRSFTPAEYQKMNAPYFLQSGFYEEELGREVSQFGNVTQVQSAYQYRFTPGGKVEERGVNYLTLVKSVDRWWISELVWQEENSELPLPQAVIKK